MGEAARQLAPRPRPHSERDEGAALRRISPPPPAPPIAPRFESLVASAPRPKDGPRRSPLMMSLVVHSLLAAALILIPLFSDEIPPAADGALRAFFAMPAVAAPPPPPPPPPPAAGARPRLKAPATARPPESASFVAPIEVPDEIVPEESLSLGVEGGVPGGVEGGVPGGVVGGIVGGIPTAEPPPPARVVRVGGQIKAPRLLRTVMPEYPQLATQAHLSAMIIIQLRVDADGRIKTAEVLRGQALFDEPALAAVRQWRYAPLLLNGVPTEFIVNVTVTFRLQAGTSKTSS